METVGNRREGLEDLKKAIDMVIRHPHTGNIKTTFTGIVQEEIEKLKIKILKQEELKDDFRPGWLATKLLENDQEIITRLDSMDVEELLESARGCPEINRNTNRRRSRDPDR